MFRPFIIVKVYFVFYFIRRDLWPLALSSTYLLILLLCDIKGLWRNQRLTLECLPSWTSGMMVILPVEWERLTL